MIVSSPDINVFQVKVVYDLSGTTPVVRLINQSSGPNLAGVSYWFVLKNPSGVVYHQGTEGTPDRTGVWNAEYVLSEPIPMIMGHIDWSGSDYELTAYVKDSAGTKFSYSVSTKICRPPGNKNGQKNNFAKGDLSVLMNCSSASLFVEDKTSYSYNGLPGSNFLKTIKLVIPPDSTETTPDPFVRNDVNTVSIPISYNGKYQILLDATYQYDSGDGTFVRIKFKFNACFDINCGTELCQIMCWIAKFENELESEGCTADQRHKLMLVLSKSVRALTGIMQPKCNIDVPKLIREIKSVIGSDCEDCDEAGGGINAAGGCAVPVDLTIQ